MSFREKFVITKRQNIIAMLISMGGIALNLLLSGFMTALDLPLYLDTVGTILVAVIGGYLPGVLVGFITNIIKSFFDSVSFYYGVLNVLIAFFAAFLARRGLFKRPWGIILSTLIFILIGGGLGAFLPMFMDELTFDSEALSGLMYSTGYFSLELSYVLSSILMDIPDKLITILIVLIILHFIPEKFYDYARFKWWMQKPILQLKAEKSKKVNNRWISLRGKVLIALGFSLAAITLAGMGICMHIYRKTLIKENTNLAEVTVEIAADIIDGDYIDLYVRKHGEAKNYKETEELLTTVLQSSKDVKYLYVYKILDNGCQVIFDINADGSQGEEIGTIIEFDEGFLSQVPDLLEGNRIDPIITNDHYGYLLTAYEPVYDSADKCVCYVGADIDMTQIVSMERSFFVEMFSIYLGFFVVLIVFVNWFIEYQISLPVNTITKSVKAFSQNGDEQQEMDNDVKKLKEIEIRTGDEVEQLYDAICIMTSNQAEQMRSVRRLSESTAKMQDGLIITMADMVENRDSDTGAHIQKTAAYVKIIVEGLKKKGYYKDKITPKFMSDVVRSAPLHDVGKINIPDTILNKPGKLTDEEYEIMKTHTTAGKHIIEKAIDTVEGGSYLKEARNMAAYHHERWDGKGYPEQLSGEIIPLSARIMAVADVFDALTSPRVYKPAFPIDKAIEMIKEGAGSQFDPKCVEVFIDSLPEVQVVLKKYSQNIKR